MFKLYISNATISNNERTFTFVCLFWLNCIDFDFNLLKLAIILVVYDVGDDIMRMHFMRSYYAYALRWLFLNRKELSCHLACHFYGWFVKCERHCSVNFLACMAVVLVEGCFHCLPDTNCCLDWKWKIKHFIRSYLIISENTAPLTCSKSNWYCPLGCWHLSNFLGLLLDDYQHTEQLELCAQFHVVFGCCEFYLFCHNS